MHTHTYGQNSKILLRFFFLNTFLKIHCSNGEISVAPFSGQWFVGVDALTQEVVNMQGACVGVEQSRE